MCDTFVYVPSEKETCNIIFAKNSDREPNEAQNIVRIPAQQHKTTKLKCTFIEIPQVKETYELILSKPFQMWGKQLKNRTLYTGDRKIRWFFLVAGRKIQPHGNEKLSRIKSSF
jgi:hypothetical protein